MKRVLLIDPPWYRLFGSLLPRIPIGPAYLGSVLEAEGHAVKVYMADFDAERARSGQYFSHQDTLTQTESYHQTLDDLNAPVWNEVRAVIRSFQPDVVGLSVMTGKYGSGLNVARLTKELAKTEGRDIKVIMGGPHVSALPEEVAREDCVDVAFKREAEISLTEWLKVVDRPEEWGKVQGLTFVDGNGQLVDTGSMPYINDLDTLPLQGLSLIHI